MDKLQKRILIGLIGLVLGLGMSTTASAKNLSIALTALVQESIIEVSPNVYEYTSTTVRVTQKDVLNRLAEFYTFPSGSLLDCNGFFQIIPSDGSAPQPVSGSYLKVIVSTSVLRGRSDANFGGRISAKYFTPADFLLHVGAMSFNFHGIMEETLTGSTGGLVMDTYSFALQGGGTLDGKVVTVSGKMRFKFPQT